MKTWQAVLRFRPAASCTNSSATTGGCGLFLFSTTSAACERLVKVTTPLLLRPPVVTDSRKIIKMGIWRSFLRILLIILHVEFRLLVLPRTFFQDVR